MLWDVMVPEVRSERQRLLWVVGGNGCSPDKERTDIHGRFLDALSIPVYRESSDIERIPTLAEERALRNSYEPTLHYISITYPTDDWLAAYSSASETWGMGPNIAAAVGNLILAHAHKFNIVLEAR